jgi:hypothetical protein
VLRRLGLAGHPVADNRRGGTLDAMGETTARQPERAAWTAIEVAVDSTWFILEPRDAVDPLGEVDDTSFTPSQFVVLTAANPDGTAEGENESRHRTLRKRIESMEPWIRPPVLREALLRDGERRLPAIVLDISREEASDIAREFGHASFLAFGPSGMVRVQSGPDETGPPQPVRIRRKGPSTSR